MLFKCVLGPHWRRKPGNCDRVSGQTHRAAATQEDIGLLADLTSSVADERPTSSPGPGCRRIAFSLDDLFKGLRMGRSFSLSVKKSICSSKR